MNIKVNGKPQEVSYETVTVEQLLDICKVKSPEMVAVQHNGTFVKKEEYAKVKVQEGDEIDFLYFMGGGAVEL